MKLLSIFFLFIVISNGLFPQEIDFPIDEETGKITFSEAVKVEGASSQELYFRAKEWFAHEFVSAQDVIQMDAGHVNFTAEILVKDGRYKYILTDFWHEIGTSGIASTPGDLRAEKPGGGMMSMGKRNWDGIKKQSFQKAISIIESIEEAMVNNFDEEDDW